MRTRIISAVVFIAFTLFMICFSVETRILFFVACCICSCHEMKNALKKLDYSVQIWAVHLICVCGAVLIYFDLGSFVFPAATVILLALFALLILGKRFGVKDLFATYGVCFYPLAPLMLVIYISTAKTASGVEKWPIVFLSAILPSVVSDTFALFGGRLFGKTKLAPHISPNKTIEGLVCGIVMGTLSGFGVYYILKAYALDVIPLWAVLLAALLSSIAGAIGDLAASSIKREAGIKDYSNLIPGHGGMMDRIDSELFSIPVIYLLYALFF